MHFDPHRSSVAVGNEVHISVCTETEYEKKDSNNHFGLKCQLVGYEWTSDPAEVHTCSQGWASRCP